MGRAERGWTGKQPRHGAFGKSSVIPGSSSGNKEMAASNSTYVLKRHFSTSLEPERCRKAWSFLRFLRGVWNITERLVKAK